MQQASNFAQCCLCLWIVHSRLHLRFSLNLSNSSVATLLSLIWKLAIHFFLLCLLPKKSIISSSNDYTMINIWSSLTWPTFENFIVSLGLQAKFLPESYLMDFIPIDCCFST